MSDINGFDNKDYGAKVWLNQILRLARIKRIQKKNYINVCSKHGHKKPFYFKHEWPDYICILCGTKYINSEYVVPPKPTFMKNLKDKDKPWSK